MSYVRVGAVVLAAALASGCVSAVAQQNLTKPVNCDAAHANAEALEMNKAAAGKILLANFAVWLPPLQLIPLANGDFNGTWEISIGRYNQKVERKRLQVLQSCGLWP